MFREYSNKNHNGTNDKDDREVCKDFGDNGSIKRGERDEDEEKDRG